MIKKIEQLLGRVDALKDYKIEIEVDSDKIVTLDGEIDTWQHVVDIGHLVASLPEVANVVNKITSKGIVMPRPDHRVAIDDAKKIGIIRNADVLIIGGGISGCAIARELSKYRIKTILTDKNDDICEGATKANSGAIHAGHMVKPGTLKARLNVKGNAMYDKWAEELNFTLLKRGSLGVAYTEEDVAKFKKVYQVAVANGVPGVRLLSGAEGKAMEPNLPGDPVMVLYNPTMGSVEPYEVCIALGKNAAANGVEFMLGNPVLEIVVNNQRDFSVVTTKGIIKAAYVINAAGVFADDIAEMVGDKFFTIHPRRGTIAIFDKAIKSPYSKGVGMLPSKNDPESKGGGCGPTPAGNLQAGPSATETPDKEDDACYPSDLEYSLERGRETIAGLDPAGIITYFTGVRAPDYKEDFIIGMSRKVAGFINVAAIQSPGLVSAPAVAEMVENIIIDDYRQNGRHVEKNPRYNPIQPKKVAFRKLSNAERDELIKKNPKHGHIICRCETITEGEILDAIHSEIVPTSVDAIKRRTRAGMGRCQGGFCQQKVIEILARELGKEWVEITLKGKGSYILDSYNRQESQPAPQSNQAERGE